MAVIVANRRAHADRELSLILSGACYSCRCMLACSWSVRAGCGFLSACCVCAGKETHRAQKLQSNLFRSRDHALKGSVVAGILHCWQRLNKETCSSYWCQLLQAADCLYESFCTERKHHCWETWIRFITMFSTRGAPQRSHSSFDPSGHRVLFFIFYFFI